MKRHSQQGVALVITLILLSVITFMAVTFLVVSRHESAAVNTLSQQSNAKFAADQALQRAMGEIASRMLAGSNGLNLGLVVSTNYIQQFFYPGNTSITNVCYYDNTGINLLSPPNMQQMIGNLQILPRAPVFITTNKAFAPDFRFYLDLNRNGMYDPSFLGTDLNGNLVYYTGDPEWIGILNHPNLPHSASNQFVGRYCVFAVPIGNSLDLNYGHNQAKAVAGIGKTGGALSDGFIRNQGVGSWEINQAALLSALNTNYWGIANGLNNYRYLPTTAQISPQVSPVASGGTAFLDANSLLQYRYNANYLNLNAFARLYPLGVGPYASEFIDGYGVGPLMLGPSPLTTPQSFSTIGRAWSGDDCPNPFFSTQDLFNSSPIMAGFSNRLYSAGLNIHTNTGNAAADTAVNNYNRYTFYRLFSQMGFGSAPEPAPYPHSTKLNLNYMNVNGVGATNFIAWQPLQFFTNAANAMLTNAGYPFTVANIPIYPVNYYTPGIHRLLQLAANIYDASTNKTSAVPDDFDYPSVFRPLFGVTNVNGIKNIYITGYALEGPNTADYGPVPLSLTKDLANITPNTTNIYGIPWVIGARKGFPNFNAFSMESVCQITRKLQVLFQKQTNVQYSLGVSNLLGAEAWNSYSNAYPRGVRIVGFNLCTMILTNELGMLLSNTIPTTIPATNISAGQWQGYSAGTGGIARSFITPLMTNALLLSPGSVYHPNVTQHFSSDTNFDVLPPYIPQFGLNVTNRFVYIMVDQTSGRVIDYVTLDGMSVSRNLTTDLATGAGEGGVWSTNIINGQFDGFSHQMEISMGNGKLYYGFDNSQWIADSLQPNSLTNEQTSFAQFIIGNDGTGPRQAPFTPTANITYSSTWQANDPLVHYTLNDLTPMVPTNFVVGYPGLSIPVTLTNFGQQVNTRYLPWGNAGNLKGTNVDGANAFNLAVKDPQIINSDAWQFPTNKYPNIGWLGRVHRGTPWQTVYLKSPVTDSNNWQTWTGNLTTNVMVVGNNLVAVLDAQLTHPTNDWKILDLFTTALNDNASRGQLSVNQTNLAAWAAVLDGVFVLTNETVAKQTTLQPEFIDPSDTVIPTNTGIPTSTVEYLVSRINAVRGTNVGGVFTSLGQILSVPELTVASPYINSPYNNANVTPTSAAASVLTDAAYERIPQQIMSLLRVGTPRYVIFAYGQSLKPADHSIVQSGPYFGMCTNYQITGETATRTLVRFENSPIPGQVNTNTPRAVIEQYNVLPPGN